MGNIKIIGASAGSGKTYRLAYEYVRTVVENPNLYRHILAVTFTNKATEEMRLRILERLHELADDKPSPYLTDLLRDLTPLTERKIRERATEAQRLILHDYSRFAVLTIDRFFQRLIRSFIRELGVEVNFNLELETDSLLGLAADALIEDSASDSSLRARLFAAARNRLDENKRWDIKEPLLDLGCELFGEEYQRVRGTQASTSAKSTPSSIETVAGRARDVQSRFAEVAREMQQTILSYGLTLADFKGKSHGLVPWLAKITNKGEFLPLSKYVRQELDGDTLTPELKSRLAELDTLYSDNFRFVASARLLSENHHNFLLLADLQQRIERICTEENIMPISETNRVIARLVGGNDTPFIFEKAGSWFSRFFIDEFQDTSTSQWENFVPLLRNSIASEEGEPVMLIGDIKQAIYRWRGSDWQILSHRVHEEMGDDRVKSETLDTNYRSLPAVVEFNNRAIGLVAEAGNASLNGMVAGALAEGSLKPDEAAKLTDMLSEAYLGHTQKPLDNTEEGYVTITLYGADDAGEWIPPVVERIEELQSRGYRAGDIAVLVRSNTQGARVAQMLLQRKHANSGSHYCYDVVTAEALTVGASAVSRFIVACLSLAVDDSDTIQRAVFNDWLGRDFEAPLNENDTVFFSRLAVLSPEEAFEEIVLRFELQNRAFDVAYIQAVHQQITSFLARSVADIPLFLEWWNENGASASISMQGGGAITISTIHKSKGLQYKVVIIPYLSWAMGPDTRGKQLVVWAEASEKELAEAGAMPVNYKEQMAGSFFSERYYREQVLAHIDALNLLYVALTRAENELHMMVSTNPHDGRNSVGNVLRRALGIERDFTEWGVSTMPTATMVSAAHRDTMVPPAEENLVRPADSVVDTAPHNGLTSKELVADKCSGSGESDSSGFGALCSYPTARPGARVRLRLPADRYFGNSEGVLSPRNYGVLMHLAFERAVAADDVGKAVYRMLLDGYVSPGEYARLQKTVADSFANPLVAGWFGGEWDRVNNEVDILLPKNSGRETATRRPDRVMIRGARAVVVDYKFGGTRRPEYAAQIRGYADLLRSMGHTEIEAYLWYVTLDIIEKVEV